MLRRSAHRDPLLTLHTDRRYPHQPNAPDHHRQHLQEVKVDFDDLNHLSQYVVIGRDWNRALAYQTVLTLRKMREPNSFASNTSAETIDAGLLNASPQVFWKALAQDRGACFLEAKFPGSVPADYFESIEVSKQDLPIVLAWPEAAPYKSIIHEIPAKSATVK